MKKVKNIIFKLDLYGQGIVNYDSGDQKYYFLKTNLKEMYSHHNNTSYAKKNFYGTNKEDLSYKIKISNDCLMRAIFSNDMQADNASILDNENLLYGYLASPATLLRGHMKVDKSAQFKRKGCLSIADAEQSSDTKSIIEAFSRSGAKNTDAEKDGSDNSFFFKETVGEISYKTEGVIDLMGLQFVSTDLIFDRLAFNPDKFDLYKQYLKMRIPNFNSELGYYKLSTSIDGTPEYGMLLSNENVVFLVKEFFRRLIVTSINRRSAFARVSSVKYKLVTDVLTDTVDSDDNWNEIKSHKDIDNMNFDVEYFYEALDTEVSEKLREDIKAEYESKKAKNKKDKEEKKQKMESAKKKKEADSTSEQPSTEQA